MIVIHLCAAAWQLYDLHRWKALDKHRRECAECWRREVKE